MKVFLYCFLIFVVYNVADDTKYEYEVSIISNITEATYMEAYVHKCKRKPEYVCDLPVEKRSELCREAWKVDYLREHGYQRVQNDTVGPKIVYRILYYQDTWCCKDRKELIASGFECPSNPPYYLRQGSKNESVYVTVVSNDTQPNHDTHTHHNCTK